MVTITHKSDLANRKEQKMKKVVIFGAAGHTGRYITEKMKAEKLRGFEVRSLRFPLARFKQKFGSFCAQFWGQQPAAKGG